MNEQVIIPEWLKEEETHAAAILSLLFDIAKKYPNMTFAEYSKSLQENITKATYERVQNAEKGQFAEGVSV